MQACRVDRTTYTPELGAKLKVSHQSVGSVLVLGGVVLAAAAGCRTASKPFSGLTWATPAATRVASAAPVAPLASQAVSASSNSPTADGKAELGAGANEQPQEKDPLYGFYPKDDSSDSVASSGRSSGTGTSQSVPRTGSFSSSSSGGCTSGCCPQ